MSIIRKYRPVSVFWSEDREERVVTVKVERSYAHVSRDRRERVGPYAVCICGDNLLSSCSLPPDVAIEVAHAAIEAARIAQEWNGDSAVREPLKE